MEWFLLRRCAVIPPADRKRLAILVVDDDSAFLEATTAVLELHHDVVHTPFSRNAVRYFQGGHFDVVIVDWLLSSGTTSLELIRQIRSLGAPGILVATAHPDDFLSDTDPSFRKGLALLTKPFRADVLLDRVDQLGRLSSMKALVKELAHAAAPREPVR